MSARLCTRTRPTRPPSPGPTVPSTGYAAIFARMGSAEPVPVAPYGPRGSDQSLANIVQAMREAPTQNAVLLGNHGILAFGSDVGGARQTVFALEETAQLAILASAVGTPRAIPPHMVTAAQQRRVTFEAAGAVTAAG
jgi:ribulose-5-phosphate 4-epimerase/fuculose-1-phosphate aldolase